MIFSHMADNTVIYGAMVAILGTILIISWAGIAKIRHFVIDLTQFCAVLSLALSAIAGAIFGFTMGRATAGSVSPSGDVVAGVFAAAVGAFLFFAVVAIPFSLLFLLTDISINTRRLGDIKIDRAGADVRLDDKPNAAARDLSRVDPVGLVICIILAVVVVGVILVGFLTKP